MKRVSMLGLTASLVALSVWSGPSYAQSGSKDVTIVVPEAPGSLDPCDAGESYVSRIIKQNVTETLLEIDPIVGSLHPRLATEWTQTGPGTWRFNLRQDVKFQDGSDFGSKDVAASLERMLDPNLEPCATRLKFFDGITITTNIIDDHTIEIASNPPQTILPTILTNMLVTAASTEKGKLTEKPIGTGPYRLDSWDRDQSIVLSRFDDYWGGAPEVEKATYLWRGESALQAAMVATGEADIALAIAPQDATDEEMDFSYLNAETLRARIRKDQPPLDDVRVRKALNLATDRQAFIGTIFSEDTQLAEQLVVAGVLGYNPDIVPYPFDPEAAKRLLEEARAAGVPVDREINLIERTGTFPGIDEVVQILSDMWRAVGFNINVKVMEANQYYSVATKPYDPNEQPTILIDMHDNTSGDAAFTVPYKYSSSGSRSDTNDPKLDEMIEKAGAATDEERRALYQEIFRTLSEDLATDVNMFHMVGYTRVSPRLDYTPTILTNNELQLSQIKFKE